MESHDFVGCIMEFAVNGRPLEPSQALAADGILDQYVIYTIYLNSSETRGIATWERAFLVLAPKLWNSL